MSVAWSGHYSIAGTRTSAIRWWNTLPLKSLGTAITSHCTLGPVLHDHPFTIAPSTFWEVRIELIIIRDVIHV